MIATEADWMIGTEADWMIGTEADWMIGTEADQMIGTEADRMIGTQADRMILYHEDLRWDTYRQGFDFSGGSRLIGSHRNDATGEIMRTK